MAIAIGGNQISKAYLGLTEIQKMYLGVDLVFDNTAPPITLTPIMTNFRVNEATPTHVHFDMPLGPVTGLTIQGFSIADKTISAVDTTLGYFTVDSAFNYYDNHSIELIGGNGVVYDFSLDPIKNNIATPITSNVRYVEVGANGGGLNIGDPMSISNAVTNAPANTTVHVKKGTYSYTGDSNLNHGNSGTLTGPIIFKGYDTTPGDLDNDLIVNSFTYTSPAQAEAQIDPTKWPVFQGNNGAQNASAFFTNGQNFIIYKNIQAKKFDFNFWSYGSTDIVWYNCTSALGAWSTSSGSGFRSGTVDPSARLRVDNCVSFDNLYNNVWIHGDHVGVVESKVVAGIDGAGGTDYNIILLPATNSVIRDNHAEIQDTPTASIPHGIGIKQTDYVLDNDECTKNCIADNTVIQDSGETLYIAHQGGAYNVVKRNHVTGIGSKSNLVGARCRVGAHHNIFEQNYFNGMTDAINFYSDVENQPINSGYLVNDNIFRNNVFQNCYRALNTGNDSGNVYTVNNNQIINNTFYNITGFMWVINANTGTFVNNIWKNNILVSDGSISLYSGAANANSLTQTYNDYWNTGQSTPSGTGNVSVDPNFVDLIDFVPQADILSPKIVDYDWKYNERAEDSGIGGSIQISESPTPPIPSDGIYPTGNAASPGTGEANNVDNYGVQNSVVESDATEHQDGSYSVKGSAGSSSFSQVYAQDMSAEIGETYDIKVWAKCNSIVTQGIRLQGTNWTTEVTTFLDSTDWKEYTFTAVASSATPSISFYNRLNGGSSADIMWIDNITIIKQ